MKRTLAVQLKIESNKKRLIQEDMFSEMIPTILINQGVFTWARVADNHYECSSLGDQRFSALTAKLKDGRTIEEAYQLDVKGYRSITNNWHKGKGKQPLTALSPEQLWEAYLFLWETWSNENSTLMDELAIAAKHKVLTDCFAWTPISQARALSVILNNRSNADLRCIQSNKL